MEKYKDFKNIEGFSGYVTYREGNSILSTYWKETEGKNKIFITYRFNNTSDYKSVTFDRANREPNKIEELLFSTQNKIKKLMQSDSHFILPKGCGYNFVFLRDINEIRIVVLTGTKDYDIIPFGNDYEFTIDLSGNVLNSSPIHPIMSDGTDIKPSYDPVKQVKKNNSEYDLCSHNHYYIHPESITSTDICNILLYGKGEYYIVFSRNYSSLFNPNNSHKLDIFPNEFIKKQK